MKTFKILILSTLVVFNISFLKAQEYQGKSQNKEKANTTGKDFRLHGFVVDTSIKHVQVVIDTAVLGRSYNDISGLDTISQELKNKRFDIVFHEINHPGYVTIYLFDRNGKTVKYLPGQNFFMPGDNIDLLVSQGQFSGGISFSGKGAEKFNFIEVEEKRNKNPSPFKQAKEVARMNGENNYRPGWLNIDTVEKFVYEDLLAKFARLQPLKYKMAYREYNFLLADLIYNFKLSCLDREKIYGNQTYFQSRIDEYRTLKKHQVLRLSALDEKLNVRNVALIYSENYLNYIAMQVISDPKIDGDLIFKYAPDERIAEIKEDLREKFVRISSANLPQNLKDKLLLREGMGHVLRLKPEDQLIVFNCLADIIKDRNYHQIVSGLIHQYLPGLKGADVAVYTFIDTQGKTVKLSDFKNKVVVIDLWYTGCGGCMDVAAAIPGVEEKFKDNHNVVFLSISIDRDKDTWLKSISKYEKPSKKYFFASRYYSGVSTIYLKTIEKDADGASRSFSSFAKVYAPENTYPVLLIIDAQEKMYVKNPPRPDIGDGQNKLAKEITNAISSGKQD